jgi:hypothetical protein
LACAIFIIIRTEISYLMIRSTSCVLTGTFKRKIIPRNKTTYSSFSMGGGALLSRGLNGALGERNFPGNLRTHLICRARTTTYIVDGIASLFGVYHTLTSRINLPACCISLARSSTLRSIESAGFRWSCADAIGRRTTAIKFAGCSR